VELVNDYFPPAAGGDIGDNWNDWVLAQAVRREAEQLIGPVPEAATEGARAAAAELPATPAAPATRPAVAEDPMLAALDTALRLWPTDAGALSDRGSYYARHRQFDRAKVDFEEARRHTRTLYQPWAHGAFVCLLEGDEAGAKALCGDTIGAFADTQEPVACMRVAMTCAAAPGLVDAAALDRAGALVDRALAPGSNLAPDWGELAKGMVEYRRGHAEAAADWLGRAMASGHLLPTGRGTAHLYLAMAQFRLGRREDARQSLRRGANAIETDLAKAMPPDGNLPSNWTDWVMVHAARREAEALVGMGE
jgi:tetratricopeptide (TPR) repeat protein